ncbi:alpha carbonic anhydrase [Nemania sp. FL0916]|nr:alpha carbonic anhydrase [Nemania sp. FL0916]
MIASPKTLSFLAAGITPVFGFCGGHTYLDKRAEGVNISAFGYAGIDGPVLWHHLVPANALCGTGSNQSPINLVEGTYTIVPGSDLKVTLPGTVADGATFENLGSTIEVVTEGLKGSLVLEGQSYELKQFHWHHPGEHLDNNVSMPMEMHLVFLSDKQQTAVIGIFVDLVDSTSSNAAESYPTDTSSAMLETIFSSVDKIAAPGTTTKTAAFSMTELSDLIDSADFRRYSGSLTSPPCTEGVTWSVATKKLALSRTTFAKVREVIGFNSRFPQNTPGMPNLLVLC